MKILYDYGSFIQRYGGISRYTTEIMAQLHKQIEVDTSVLFSDNIYLEQLPFLKTKHLLAKTKFNGKKKLESVLNILYSSYKIMENNYDVFHPTYSNYYFLGFSNSSYQKYIKRPIVTTIHDMIYETWPEPSKVYLKNIECKRKLIYRSDHIIAISENTKRDILKLYPIDPKKISVIYHGAPVCKPAISGNIYGRYILFVGRRGMYKNFSFFVGSILPLLLEDPQLKLVCVGTPFTSVEVAFLNNFGIREKVHALAVSDRELYQLYQNALVFAFPSLIEGFGIPILEAFANNCPVCLSNSSCFPEIAGDAAIYFDPLDKDSILNSIREIITDKHLRSQLKVAGKKRLQLFSWEKAAQQTLAVYKSVVR